MSCRIRSYGTRGLRLLFETLEQRRLLAVDILEGNLTADPLPDVAAEHPLFGASLSRELADLAISSEYVPGLGYPISHDLFVLAEPMPEAAPVSSSTSAACHTLTDGSHVCLPAEEAGQGGPPFGMIDGSLVYAIGRVHVSIVAFESDGSVDLDQENWNDTKRETIRREVLDGLKWWEDAFDIHNPNSPHDLTFSIDFTFLDNPIPSPYELIHHNGVSHIEDSFSDHTGVNTASWNRQQRDLHNADFAFTAYVIDSEADIDGAFPNGRAAFATLGGPLTVLSTDNSIWGIDRFDHVLAHETGHIFRALDEYHGGHPYGMQVGYYKTPLLNALKVRPYEAGPQEPSVMAGYNPIQEAWGDHHFPQSTQEILGWRDRDADGIIDIFDQLNELHADGGLTGETMDPTTNAPVAAGDLYRIQGRTHPGTYLEPGVRDHPTRNNTLNHVETLQFRIDGGFIDALPSEVFGAGNAGYRLADSEGGWFTLETRTNEYEWEFDHYLNLGPIHSIQQHALNSSEAPSTPAQTIAGQHVDAVDMNAYEPLGASIDVIAEAYQNNTLDQHGLVVLPVEDVCPCNVHDGGSVVRIGNPGGSIGFAIPGVAANGPYNHVIELRTLSEHGIPSAWWADDTTRKGISFSKTALETNDAGKSDSFEVRLDWMPDAPVMIDFAFDPAHNQCGQSQLTFDETNWWIAQTVVVDGVIDHEVDGNVDYDVTATASSTDSDYQSLSLSPLSVSHEDLDIVALLIDGKIGAFSVMQLIEGGSARSFDIALSSRPTDDVIVTFQSTDPRIALEFSTPDVIFTPENWNQTRTVQVSAVDNSHLNETRGTNIFATIASNDANWDDLFTLPQLYTSILDDEAPQLLVTQGIRPDSPVVVSEDRSSVVLQMVLSEQPVENVSVSTVSTDSFFSEVTAIAPLSFTPSNWNIPQTFEFIGRDDDLVDGDQLVDIVFFAIGATDPAWQIAQSKQIYVLNKDNDGGPMWMPPWWINAAERLRPLWEQRPRVNMYDPTFAARMIERGPVFTIGIWNGAEIIQDEYDFREEDDLDLFLERMLANFALFQPVRVGR